MRKSFIPSRRSDMVFVLLLLCVFSMICLLLVTVSSGLYQHTAQAAADDDALRTGLLYVANKTRHVSPGEVYVLDDPRAGAVLVLGSQEPAYKTLIYYHDGALRELYQDPLQPLQLDAGASIVAAAGFELQYGPPLLTLRLTTQSGESASLMLHVGGTP